MDITIHVPQLDALANAINALAQAIPQKGAAVTNISNSPHVAAPEPSMSAPATQVPPTAAVPVQPFTPTTDALMQMAPVTPTIPQQQTLPGQASTQTAPTAQSQTVPTQDRQYSLQDLSMAGAAVLDGGKGVELRNMLAKYGIQAIVQLPQEYYGAFATDLRLLGAKI